MSEEILVSVIIPTYNRCERLIKTISSVQNQSLRDIEILVCNDGSTDETTIQVEKICRYDSRVKLINCGANGRPAIPRNMGIKMAQGRWLAFVDDDDCWSCDKLEKQLSAMQRTGVLACCTNAENVSENDDYLGLYFCDREMKKFSFWYFLLENPVICSSMVVRRDVINRCNGFPEELELRAIEDYALWMRVALCTSIYYLHEPLVQYLYTSGSSIREKETKSFATQRKIVLSTLNEWIKTQTFGMKCKYGIQIVFFGGAFVYKRFVKLINRYR